MARRILAVFAGLIAAMATFLIIEQIGSVVYPPPTGLNFEDKAAMKLFMESRPLGAYIIVIAGWLLGSLEAGFICHRISKHEGTLLPAILGGLLTASAVVNFYLLPHPAWFVVVGIVMFVPAVFMGWTLSRQMQ